AWASSRWRPSGRRTCMWIMAAPSSRQAFAVSASASGVGGTAGCCSLVLYPPLGATVRMSGRSSFMLGVLVMSFRRGVLHRRKFALQQRQAGKQHILIALSFGCNGLRRPFEEAFASLHAELALGYALG